MFCGYRNIVLFFSHSVWFSEPLTFEGGYYGETAVLKCQAEKAAVMKGQIKYDVITVLAIIL